VPFPEEILQEIHLLASEPNSTKVDPRRSWMKRVQLTRN
jgi:hypothetical protein